MSTIAGGSMETEKPALEKRVPPRKLIKPSRKRVRRRAFGLVFIAGTYRVKGTEALLAVPPGSQYRRTLHCWTPAVPNTSSFQRHPSHNNSIVKATPDNKDEREGANEELVVVTNAPAVTKPKPKKRPRNIRLQVFSTLNQPIVEVASALAVILSSLLVALRTLNDLPLQTYVFMDDALLALNILFFVDFFVRWYAAGQLKPIYLRKPLVVLDIIVVVIPFLTSSAVVPILQELLPSDMEGGTILIGFLAGLENSAGLQNLLLLRVLRLRRVLTDMTTFGKFTMAIGVKSQDVRPYQLQLARVLLSIFTLLSVSSGLIYTAEHVVNPDIPDYFTALYFGLTTLTTVGFGDISPVTSQGRLVVSGSILAGVAIIPAQAAKLVDIFIESSKDLEQTGKFRQRSLYKRPKIKTSRPSGSAADGKGPSGVSIDITAAEAVISTDGGTGLPLGETLEDTTRTCVQCGTFSHRIDASFCWSCGSEL